jgi:RNA polymerase sigma-70 factor, ECF subfamily
MTVPSNGERKHQNGLPPDLIRSAYAQLRELASLYLAGRRGTVLQATSLVHEAFVRLARNEARQWESEAHFAAVAATVMRRILVDEVRARTCRRRGGGWDRLELEDVADCGGSDGGGSCPLELLALDEALTDLAQLSQRQARVVELRYFGGLSTPQIAEVLGVSRRTVEGDWSIARAWLKNRIEGTPQP